ncbi:PA1571 family protein [Pseudomonas aeruginosa]|uniref:PA1571 family protein n=1 Tax=Pseudomonas aeruginosa TaxID=287 RepID=UPI0008729247|nr:PA1571 family protein [Pseudomonas aeruginosa]OFB92553.1 hypothetical protein AN468_15970 [Pseudomonas aeruginosa]
MSILILGRTPGRPHRSDHYNQKNPAVAGKLARRLQDCYGPWLSAIIDAQGREIPITEVMIQRACRELDRSLEQEQKQA